MLSPGHMSDVNLNHQLSQVQCPLERFGRCLAGHSAGLFCIFPRWVTVTPSRRLYNSCNKIPVGLLSMAHLMIFDVTSWLDWSVFLQQTWMVLQNWSSKIEALRSLCPYSLCPTAGFQIVPMNPIGVHQSVLSEHCVGAWGSPDVSRFFLVRPHDLSWSVMIDLLQRSITQKLKLVISRCFNGMGFL